jgi:hypothetical protein
MRRPAVVHPVSVLALAAVLVGAPVAALAQRGGAPPVGTPLAGDIRSAMPGVAVLQQMRAAYDGTWYRTLTFVQKTGIYRNGQKTEQTWYESVRQTPTRTELRIDVDDLAAGNGVLTTPDSTWRIRSGVVAAAQDGGNEFLPLIMGVYLQPVAQTTREIAAAGVDLSRVRSGQWRGRPVTVVGASAAGDTTTAQFWVDDQRQVVVRMVLNSGAGAPVVDVHLDGYEPVGKAWIATKILIHVNGALVQDELYTSWKADVPLDDALFDVSRWTAPGHWARKP